MKINFDIIILIMILLILFISVIPTIHAATISTDSYSISSSSTGTTSGNFSTDNYGATYSTAYQQGTNRDVATETYSVNSGGLNNSIYFI